jgi:hypothetical protein
LPTLQVDVIGEEKVQQRVRATASDY